MNVGVAGGLSSCSFGVTEGDVRFCGASRDCVRARETFVKKNQLLRSSRLENYAPLERPAPSDILKADSVLVQARYEAALALERLRSEQRLSDERERSRVDTGNQRDVVGRLVETPGSAQIQSRC